MRRLSPICWIAAILLFFFGIFDLTSSVVGYRRIVYQHGVGWKEYAIFSIRLETIISVTVFFFLPAILLLYVYLLLREKEQLMENFTSLLKIYRKLNVASLASKMGISNYKANKLLLRCLKKGYLQGRYDEKLDEFVADTAVKKRLEVTSCYFCGAPLSEETLVGETVKCQYCDRILSPITPRDVIEHYGTFGRRKYPIKLYTAEKISYLLGLALLWLGLLDVIIGISYVLDETDIYDPSIGVSHLVIGTSILIFPGLVALRKSSLLSNERIKLTNLGTYLKMHRRIKLTDVAKKSNETEFNITTRLLKSIARNIIRGFIDRVTYEFFLEKAIEHEITPIGCPSCGGFLSSSVLVCERPACPYCSSAVSITDYPHFNSRNFFPSYKNIKRDKRSYTFRIVAGGSLALFGTFCLLATFFGPAPATISVKIGAWAIIFLFMLFPASFLVVKACSLWRKTKKLQNMSELLQREERIKISVLAEIMQMSEVEIENLLRECVEKNLIVGYIDRYTDEFFTVASLPNLLNINKCIFCGTPIRVVVRGIYKCGYCGGIIPASSRLQ